MTQEQAVTALVNWIYNTPPWLTTGVFVALACALIAIVLIPFRLVVRREFRSKHHEVFAFAVTNIAVLYAVLLAFIAVATWENFSHAGNLAEVEADLTGNLLRDVDGLGSNPTTSALRASLHQYLALVVTKEWPDQQEGRTPTAGWPALETFQRTLLAVQPQGPAQTLLVPEMLHTLNELYTARRSRVDASQEHIPAVVWDVLLIMGALTVGFTFLLGVESLWAHLIASVGVGVALVLVVALIVQLDYPFRGTLSVSADPYESVIANMDQPHPAVVQRAGSGTQ